MSKSTAAPTSHEKSPRRVLILTGGGDAPGLNAVLRAFVKTATDLDIEVFGSEDAFEGLLEDPPRVLQLGPNDVRGILPKGGSILGCSNRADPFAYPVTGPDGTKQTTDLSHKVLDRLQSLGIDALVLVGGDGTQALGLRFAKLGMPVVGIPKTIDNDLAATDTTFGLDTAVGTATWAIDALHSTAEAHDRVMILEVMGRDAGWIAMQSGIAGGADVILIPEIPYEIGPVIEKINARSSKGHHFSIIVIGEGSKPAGDVDQPSDAPKHGAGDRLRELLEGRIDHDIRVTVLGHLQRGGSPSAFDRLLGTRFGVHAAQLCDRGTTGVLVALKGQDIVAVPLETAVANSKRVPPDGELVMVARALGIETGQE
jgi:phosphofructokinase-like protein